MRELTAKHDRAQQILEGGEGALSLNVHQATAFTNIVIEAEDREGLEEAIAMLEEEIQSARGRLERFGHARPRRRKIRSRWMEKR
jgi:hypothetical protein